MPLQFSEERSDQCHLDILGSQRAEISTDSIAQVSNTTSCILPMLLPPSFLKLCEHNFLESARRKERPFGNFSLALRKDILRDFDGRLMSAFADDFPPPIL